MSIKKILITGASGYVAAQLIPTLKEKYELVLLDVQNKSLDIPDVPQVQAADLTDQSRSTYEHFFTDVDCVIHLAYKRRKGLGLDDFFVEKENVNMAYNVFRSALENKVRRVVMASSNHAADWYEHNLVHTRRMDMVEPYSLALSDNFYGWAKASYEHLGFLFANGVADFNSGKGRESHVKPQYNSQSIDVVMVRIGAPREIRFTQYMGDLDAFKRDLGAYLSPRDMCQLFIKSIETSNIRNEYGVPWLVVYGISDNTRAFWSLVSAREVLGYDPIDDSEVKFASEIHQAFSDVPPEHQKGKLANL